MTADLDDSVWRGTSDVAATVRARAPGTTVAQRIAWLTECVDVAHATGALDRLRERRQRELEAWWAATSPPEPEEPASPSA